MRYLQNGDMNSVYPINDIYEAFLHIFWWRETEKTVCKYRENNPERFSIKLLLELVLAK